LAKRGRNLVLVARSKDKLETLKSEISAKHSVKVEVIEQDLSPDGAATQLLGTLNDRGIKVDLLVNNAGFGSQGESWTVPVERQTQMLHLNIVALTELTSLLLPAMIERRAGGVINVSSTASFQPIPYMNVYAATKAYVTSFSMALAYEAHRYGVKVMALCPGGTATNFFEAGQFGKVEFTGGLQSPEEVVEIGLREFERGQSVSVTRFLNKLTIFAQRLVPRSVVVDRAASIFRPKNLQGKK
jgi:short-subunit dehydrogenase